MLRVALYTTFFETISGYSLVAVAETQLRMLLDHGYDPACLVATNFKIPDAPSLWRPETIDLRPVVPDMVLDQNVAPDFEERVNKVYTALQGSLGDIDVVITHDIILQTFFKEHNVAMRRYAKTRDDLLWLHWIHSCPMPGGEPAYPNDCRYTPPPGFIIYPNDSDKNLVVRTYHLTGQENRVKVCRAGHAIDPLAVWPYDRLTKDLAKKADLLGGEIVAVYPVRLDKGKNTEKVIRMIAGTKNAGYETRLLIIDWQSGGAHFQQYIDELLVLVESLGLEGCVNFTSRLDDRCSQGVPRHVVSELMDLSNVYIHASRVETYSLVVHEAMLRGCLVCLNHDFPAMRELFGDNALYFDFESDRVSRVYSPDEQGFFNDEAKRLITELKNNRAVVAKTNARKLWNPAILWRDFETLLFLRPVGE